MAGLIVEEWKAHERRKEAQILARGRAKSRAEGRTEGLEFDRDLLRPLATRRFGAVTGEYLFQNRSA